MAKMKPREMPTAPELRNSFIYSIMTVKSYGGHWPMGQFYSFRAFIHMESGIIFALFAF